LEYGKSNSHISIVKRKQVANAGFGLIIILLRPFVLVALFKRPIHVKKMDMRGRFSAQREFWNNQLFQLKKVKR